MSTVRTKPGRLFWAAVLLVTVLLYGLSVGPMYRLCPYQAIPIVHAIYEPLWILYDHSELAASILNWYLALWCGLPPLRPE